MKYLWKDTHICTVFSETMNMDIMSVTPFKVVINNRNRLSTTKKLVEDLWKLDENAQIMIIDNGSKYPPLLEWYNSIHHRVDIRRIKNAGHLALWQTGIIKDIKEDWLVYTDSDIEINENMPKNYQLVMLDIAKKYNINKVGLAISVDDIPDHYPLKEQVQRNEARWWLDSVEEGLYKADTDTTFSLIKNGHEQYESIRIAGTFTCKHIPWYLDFSNLSEEEKYYIKHTDNYFITQYTKQHKNAV